MYISNKFNNYLVDSYKKKEKRKKKIKRNAGLITIRYTVNNYINKIKKCIE